MRVSKRKVNPLLEQELVRVFYQGVADLKNAREVETVLSELLGKTELTALVKRVAIAYWLENGRSVTNIRDNLAVSSATIETIKHQLKNSVGLTLLLKKISAEEWANKWDQKIRSLVK